MKNQRAVVSELGGPESLRLLEEDIPQPDAVEVRIRVLAAGVSFADLLMREGVHPERRRPPFTKLRPGQTLEPTALCTRGLGAPYLNAAPVAAGDGDLALVPFRPMTARGALGWISAMVLEMFGHVAVTGDSNGVIRVGPVTGEVPHLLLGHQGRILALAVDPLGRWIASASMDKTLRPWPMPDLSKPPLHTLPREELIAKLKTLTNLRIVRDEESTTGWTVTHDPFPGWATAPTW